MISTATTLATFLEDHQQSSFQALTLIALVFVFGLLLRERREHMKTLREVVVLTAAISAQWDRQLDENEKWRERLDRGLSSPAPHR